MPELEIPARLRQLLGQGEIASDVDALRRAVSQIGTRNAMPFFPAFTEHGVDHLQAVLQWCEDLVPEEAWNVLDRHGAAERDAAVIVGGALLHDIGMLLPEVGFAALVQGDPPWPAPRPWFDRPQEARATPDLPWPVLWERFKAEARHLDHSDIVRILGPENDGLPAVLFDERLPRAMNDDDKLFVGEFLRRHHARLAHEIAVHGLPGVGDAWPAPATSWAIWVRELMGLVARSHNEELRTLLAMLDRHHGERDPLGVHVPYAAALLRVADYAQLDLKRAPTLLLRLAAPQTAASLDAWSQHAAVEGVRLRTGKDPGAVHIDVSPEIELSTYLQVRDLRKGLQTELDGCAAILAETYGGATDTRALALARQRVTSNLDSPSFQERLPFVPRASRLRSAEDMFRLVIHDLYGDHPWVAGRELAQNALDAIRERWRVDMSGGVPSPPDEAWPDPSDPAVDVLIEAVIGADDELALRVADRGIGMTADTVVDYFMKAGGRRSEPRQELERALAMDSVQVADRGAVADPLLMGLEADGFRNACVLDGQVAPRGRSSVVAETWMDVIGGPIPYDDADRLALTNRVYDEHPEMRSHIDRQRQLAEDEPGED